MILTGMAMVGSVLMSALALAQTPAPTYESLRDGILTAKCLKCHSAGSTSDANQMPFDTYAALLADVDDSGTKILIPGDVNDSILNKALVKTPPSMPPKKSGIPPLTPEELATVQLWIQNGAPEK